MTGAGGTSTTQTTVTVTPSGPAPTGTFKATPTSIKSGLSANLSWTSSNATSASINQGVGGVTPASGGSVKVWPGTGTTYTLTLAGPGGFATYQATVLI